MRAFFPPKLQSSRCLSSSVLLFGAQTNLSYESLLSQLVSQTEKMTEQISKSTIVGNKNSFSFEKVFPSVPRYNAVCQSYTFCWTMWLRDISLRSFHTRYHVSSISTSTPPIHSLCSLGLAFIASHVRVLRVFPILCDFSILWSWAREQPYLDKPKFQSMHTRVSISAVSDHADERFQIIFH